MTDGILCVAKPAGWTSQDVVSKVRRILKNKKAGHAGTLDPDATGVLVVAVGQATRLLPHLALEPKVYLATIGFGIATDSEDASGKITAEADASALTEEQIRAVLPQFLGEIQQVPPMVSALHHNGQRLYDLARQGITVERAPRTVTLFALEWLPDPIGLPDERRAPIGLGENQLRVTCGGGTYIRTLCKDIGLALGLPAHMKSLVREAVGPHHLTNAVSLEELTEANLTSMHIALNWPTLIATEAQAAELRLGKPIAAPEALPDSVLSELAVLFRDQLLALVRVETSSRQLLPFKVFGVSELE
jgi:tRNA pseudouridine55 synthase